MKYWQKTFLATLILFLLAFDAAAFMIADLSYQNTIESEKQKDAGEHYFISVTMAKDIRSIESRSGYTEEGLAAALESLFESYGDYYSQQGVLIGVYKNGVPLYSDLPAYDGIRPELENEPGVRNLFMRTVDGSDYIYISGELPPPEDGYTLVYAKNLAPIMQTQRELTATLLMASVLISVALAVALFLLLRQLSRPIRRLTETAQRIAAGEYGERVRVTGSDEIAQLAMSFNDMADEVEEQMDSLARAATQKQQFIDNLAHELRTPLTSISGFAEYIQKAAITDDDRLIATNYIMSESNRLKEIAYKLMDMAVMRERGIDFKDVDVPSLAEKSVAAVAVNALEKEVDVGTDIRDIRIRGDKDLLESLVVNLLDNAIKASGKGGRVFLRTYYDGAGRPCVSVADNGRGMTKEEIEQVIQPFFRVDKARSRKEGGAGLGLTLVRQIAASHNARLGFKSEAGKGTVATVVFPPA